MSTHLNDAHLLYVTFGQAPLVVSGSGSQKKAFFSWQIVSLFHITCECKQCFKACESLFHRIKTCGVCVVSYHCIFSCRGAMGDNDVISYFWLYILVE